ncbi:Protein of unknown function (DUF3727) [Xenococcus sp. PCC 7305]|uniref:DUF3727 domain-containing protein n=1 Tax=Xenococcus sp. PCC 7305 TaxID=102125 RepID=UPI0002ABFD7C|nr:DUF3727 domain-containing protein [Xenococcus sp. PCC 7305]ELS03221.1 Protein of unknown function (DUF3727) [Xenococcus sp. PCC 7305]
MSSHFSQDKEPSNEETVQIFDEKGRSLSCYIEHSLDTDGITYLLLMPVDIPIVIISWDDDDSDTEEVEAVMLEDDAEIAEIFANAKAVLAEQNLYLQHTGYSLTATGELPPIEEEQLLTLNLDEDGGDLEAEELQLLASFYHAQHKYSIYTPLTPLLFFARYNQNHELELVSPDEDEFQSILEELLFEEFDER